MGGKNLFSMLNFTPQLQIIAEYCEEGFSAFQYCAFKCFTFPRIWKDDNFGGRKEQ